MNPQQQAAAAAAGGAAEGNFELNEDLVRNVLASLGYSNVSEDDLVDILQQTAAHVSSDGESGGQGQQHQGQHHQTGESSSTTSTSNGGGQAGGYGGQYDTAGAHHGREHHSNSNNNNIGAASPGSQHSTRRPRDLPPVDEVTDEAEYAGAQELRDTELEIPSQQQYQQQGHHQAAEVQQQEEEYTQYEQVQQQQQQPNTARPQQQQQQHGVRLNVPLQHAARGTGSSSFGLTPRGGVNISVDGPSNQGGDGIHRNGSKVYRKEQEYRHQQRFNKFVAMERRSRSSNHASSASPHRGEGSSQQQPHAQPGGATHPVGFDENYGSMHQQHHNGGGNGSRPGTQQHQMMHDPMMMGGDGGHHEDIRERETDRMKERMGVQHHHAPIFYNRGASNVIYAHTDDKTYLPRRGNNASKLQMAAPRKHVDVVARGQQMRQAWKKDTFLEQKGRSDERWFVRQNMLGGGMY